MNSKSQFFLLLLSLTCIAADKPNILFIGIDDLRPELGCYGSPIAVTPHMDALAKDGLRFDRAYCQQAICSPSRASLLSGTRPDTNGITHNYVEFRDLNPELITLPQHFRQNGYETAYAGKIFHGKDRDAENSWSRKVAKIKAKKPRSAYALQENRDLQRANFAKMLAKYGEAARRGLGSGPAYESADVPDNAYNDGYNTDLAIATMKEMAAQDKPFFMALGFTKPHLNWISPTRYWDLYDREKIPMASQTAAPKDGATMGLHASFELRTRANIPKYGPLGDELSRTLKHAYLACVSYVDAQVGRAVASLEELGIRDNTIILVWSDHGWHLGDMGIWGKATNYEIGTRVPMIVWTPDMAPTIRGQGSNALVELVDMYPTLCDLAKIAKPAHLEGQSFLPLLRSPQRQWKRAAFSQFPSPALREWAANPLSPGMRETFFGPLIKDVETGIQEQQKDNWGRELFEKRLTGYAMRTEHHRLVAWVDVDNRDAAPVFVELYDHQADPGETRNIAAESPELVKQLTAQLNTGWKASRADLK